MSGYYFIDFESVDDICYQKWLQRAPEFRREEALRFRYRRDSLLSLSAYLLLEYGTNLSRPSFYCNEFGKPYLSPQLEKSNTPFFNLSHTDGIAVCFIAKEEVGIDVEHLIEPKDSLIKYVCSDCEQRKLAQSSYPSELLTRYWVLKESYLKAIGRGLSVHPCEIDFSEYETDSFCTNDGYCFRIISSILPKILIAVCQKTHNEIVADCMQRVIGL
ncbi:MAG: 4'-phosphopantetheinyl transferase superfamily protein [Planctomycetaceae bacterium]|jgi:4'-phosphopantetheinyl transferase|nr:4'-phosphopantetheinyl transferase superfamily protein [Planctomycetaceae bacterium]